MNRGFIGCGNMGGALALAISKTPSAKLYLCDTDISKSAPLQLATGGEIAEIQELPEKCDFIFLGVKPAGIGAVLSTISDALTKKPDCTVISMAAGITIEKLESFLKVRSPIIRILPNTPVAVGCGMTLFSANALVSKEIKEQFLDFMKESGKVDEIPEELIDAACAVAGCGPAFAYMFAEALANGGMACGLGSEKSITYAAQMMKGAAEMILKTDKSPKTLRENVCSPGGSTIEGVKVLFEKELPSICKTAVIASYERTKELGK